MKWEPDLDRLLSILPRMRGKRILVIGDVQLDVYMIGQATRLSREAPVPVLAFTRRFCLPGAASNPAANITALGGDAMLVGVAGDDANAGDLRAALAERGIGDSGLVVDPARPTVTKMRIVAEDGTRARQQLCRIDWLAATEMPATVRPALIERIETLIPESDLILISDYRSGMMDAEFMAAIHRANRERNIPIVVDPQGNMELYRGCYLLKCNDAEAAAQLGMRLASEEDFEAGCIRLRESLGVESAVITRSSAGMSISGGKVWNEPNYTHLPVYSPERTEVLDVTGAGDTVVAVIALALAAGATLLEAAYLSNVAAQLVVRRLGNATVTPAELAGALRRTLNHANRGQEEGEYD